MVKNRETAYLIIEEHAWLENEQLHAQVKVLHRGDIYACHIIKDKKTEYLLERIVEKTSMECIARYENMDHIKEEEFIDFFFIASRMIGDLEGKYSKIRYDVIQRRTRMTDNLYEKIPESEIEIRFANGESYYLFAYQSSSFEEYGICRKSWLDQEEEQYEVDRDIDILESYDNLQECMASDYAPLFLELHEMMCNAEDFPDELLDDGEEILPGYYMYES